METYLSQEELTLRGVREHKKSTLDRFLPGSWRRGSLQQKIPFKKQTVIRFVGKMFFFFQDHTLLKKFTALECTLYTVVQSLYRNTLSCGFYSVTICGWGYI